MLLLCWRGKQSDRHNHNPLVRTLTLREAGIAMKKIGFATLVSSGLVAAILGLAAPALAVTPGQGQRVLELVADTKIGVDHLEWLDDIRPKVNVPIVDTSVQQGR
jgi:hypothetical protein